MAEFSKPHFPKFDSRLLGTWKSDAKRTISEWKWRKRLSHAKKEKFKSLFGKLEITYTRTKVISKLRQRGWEQTQRYVVVATDETSAAIVSFDKPKIKSRRRYEPQNLVFLDELFSKPTIQHIHFDKHFYWISVGSGANREFFRKIK